MCIIYSPLFYTQLTTTPQGKLGYDIMHGYALATKAIHPQFVPWLTIDGEAKPNLKALDHLKEAVCQRVPHSKLCSA